MQQTTVQAVRTIDITYVHSTSIILVSLYLMKLLVKYILCFSVVVCIKSTAFFLGLS
jgi:hypothetical protein